MGAILFNNEQRKAIDIKNTSVAVSAAAGSGKTAVLVERIIRKITEENCDIRNLLVVTFTNAAASSMKSKIKKAIKEKIKEGKNISNLKRQLILLDGANICTVHAFCLDFLKKYSYMLPEEVPVSFSLMEDTERQLVMLKVLSDILNEYYESEDDVFEKLSEQYGGGKNDDSLLELILSLYGYLISIPDYNLWIEKSLCALTDEDDFYNSNTGNVIFNHIKNVMKSAMSKYQYALSYMEGDELVTPYYDLYKVEYNMFLNVYNCKDLYSAMNELGKIYFDSLLNHRAKKGADTTVVKGIRDKVKEIVETLRNDYREEIIKIDINSKNNLEVIYKLFEIILKFDKAFKTEKYSDGHLDFNDIEHLTISLLKDEEGNLKKDFYNIRDSFLEIMVDEFQDTNEIQETLFNLLKKDNNFFTVGDVKQSIYRFRHARPEIFLNIMKEYDNNGMGEVINLNANYRCGKNIIDVTNFIFSYCMTKENSGVDYKNKESLIFKGEDDTEEDALKTELNIVLHNKENESHSRIYEAREIAHTIKKMMNDENFKINGERLKFKDITILFRSFNNKTYDFLEELLREGIPVSYEDRVSFFETPEVKIIMSLLKVIDNPYDDISFIAALRNVFLYDDNELVKIRGYEENCTFYESFLKSNEEKDKNVLKYIEELKSFSKRYEIHLLLNKIYTDTFFDIRQSGIQGGIKRKENLERLYEVVNSYEETGFKGLSSFISYVDTIISKNKKIANAKTNEESDSVKAMTIHKSKGMEFPVVIVAEMDKKFNFLDLSKKIILNSSLGIGYDVINLDQRYKYKSVFKKIIDTEERKESILEEMRILYVALTRAKNKLILSGCINNKEDWTKKYSWALSDSSDKISYIDFMGISSFFDIVLPPLLRHKSFSQFLSPGYLTPFNVDDFDFNLCVREEMDDESVCEEKKSLRDKFKDVDWHITDEEYEKIDKEVNVKIENPLSQIPKKISVTGLKEIYNGEENQSLKKPGIYVPDFQSEKKVTNRERGILIHYVLENIDLDRLRKEEPMKVILDFLSDKPYLKDNLTFMDIKKVESFFQNPLGIKMLRSKKAIREKDFLMKMKIKDIYNDITDEREIIVQGVIDCYFYDNYDNVYLIDYKYSHKDSEEIKEEYTYQIELYKEALSKSLNVGKDKIKAFIWDINKETTINY